MKPKLIAMLLLAALMGGVPLCVSAADAPVGVLSADGRWRAYVNDADELWLHEADGQTKRRLLVPHPDDDPKRNLTGFNNPAFSPDGRVLFVLVMGWATSNALHRIELGTGSTRFLSDANDFKVLADGPQAGKLAVLRHMYRPQGGTDDVWYLITDDGKKLRRIGDEAALEKLLRARTGKTP